VPGAKKIGFVPDFIVNIGNVFLNRVTMGGGFDQLIPLIPILRFGGVLTVFGHHGGGIRERQHGFGAGG